MIKTIFRFIMFCIMLPIITPLTWLSSDMTIGEAVQELWVEIVKGGL